MSRLAGISLIVGAVSGMLSICFALFPSSSLIHLQKFPRNKFSGAVLACVALSWSTILLMRINMGFLEKYKPILLVVAPLVFVLVVFFMNDLLGPRALGGILLLVPAPILESARWHESAWRYYAIIASYIMVIKGISLILSPYLMRKWTAALLRTDSAARAWGLAGLAFSAGWIILAFTVY